MGFDVSSKESVGPKFGVVYSATPSKSGAVITFDMSNFVDRENGTPINEDFFCCLLPFFGMQSSRVDCWLR